MTTPMEPSDASSLVKRLILDLLKNPSERDKQRKIGPSGIGNPCDYCVGKALAATAESVVFRSRWWMGARIGTAIHETLEKEEEKHVEKPASYHYEALEGALIEQKVFIGTLGHGYGDIYGSADLVLVKYGILVDHKTTTKDKLKRYKLDGIPQPYVYQTMLYAMGLNKMGIKIDTITINFVCRDGSTDDDVWTYSIAYDEEKALRAWGRLEMIWDYLNGGDDMQALLDELTSADDCFICNTGGR